MECLKIIKENDTIGVIPAFKRETVLSDLRLDIEEDFDCKDFIFLQDGMPLDVSQEILTNIDSVKEEAFGLSIIKISSPPLPESTIVVQTSAMTSQPTEFAEGCQVSSDSFLRRPSSWEVRGIKIYSEDEIVRSNGFEKKRREFWNNMAKTLCKETQKSRAVIAKEINEAWRDYKTSLLLAEEKILSETDTLGTSTKETMKPGTLVKNADRIRHNKNVLDATNVEIEDIRRSQDKGPQRKRKLEMLEEKKRFYQSDMKKAQDSMRKNLNVKLSDVKKFCDNI